VDTFHVAYVCSPHKSTWHAAQQLNMARTTVHKTLLKSLKFKSYKNQLLQRVSAQLRYKFRFDFLSRLEDETFTAKIVFSDEATFHLSGNVNRHNQRIWGINNPHEVINIQETVQSYDICLATHGAPIEHL
jgi:hypothetical protein